jgi:hypothetical protein
VIPFPPPPRKVLFTKTASNSRLIHVQKRALRDYYLGGLLLFQQARITEESNLPEQKQQLLLRTVKNLAA